MENTIPKISIVTPAYNEAINLPLLYERLCQELDKASWKWEWIIVDDHSSDDSFTVIHGIVSRDQRVKCIRLSKNFGSHVALSCGLHHTSGECTIALAADLQDPPEVLHTMLERWEKGAQIIWAVRSQAGEKRATLPFFSRFYYFIMRYGLGMKQMPATGADFFLVDRKVVDAFRLFGEGNTSIFALITWMGFRQENILYEKLPRQYGRSGWTLGKKIKLVIDSITSFSYFPIRVMSFIGFGIALLGFIYAIIVLINGIFGRPPSGWASLMIVVLVIGGIQMVMMGILGEYLWRTLDETRRRPQYIIESTVNISQQNFIGRGTIHAQ